MLTYIEYQTLDRVLSKGLEANQSNTELIKKILSKIKNDFVEETETVEGIKIGTIDPDELKAFKYASSKGSVTEWKMAIAEKYNLSTIQFTIGPNGEIIYD